MILQFSLSTSLIVAAAVHNRFEVFGLGGFAYVNYSA